jgi:hypothetical protein
VILSGVDAVACSRVFMREIGSERFASLVEVLPIGDVGQRGNGDELALVQSCERCIDHLLGSHDDLCGEVVDGIVGAVPAALGKTVSVDGAGQLKDFSADAESRAIQHKLLHGQAFRSVQRSQSLDHSMFVPV